MDIIKKRKMMEILRGLIGSGFTGGQSDIAEHLKKEGFDVTQSTVSRALTRIGAVKTKKNGAVTYTLSTINSSPKFTGQTLSNLILSINHNESTIVVKTNPGSAMFVAGFIDHYCKEFCIGTVAGDDAIIVIPKSCKKIKTNIIQLSAFFSGND